MSYPLFPVFGFVGFIAGLIPFPWHLQAWNAATCAFMVWTSVGSLICAVNSIIWHGNLENPAPVWCDICTKFIMGACVGIPASSLCINRRLYKIASIRTVSVTLAEKRHAMQVDVAISLGIPVLVMALHYIVQGHRFNILEDVGCIATVFNTPPAYPLVFMWPVLLGCISFVYAFMTLRAFWKRRVQFNELLSSTNALTVNRYFRLMLLSCLEMMLSVPLTSLSIYLNSHGLTLSPWVSWADAHYNFSFVVRTPAFVWRNNTQYAVAAELSRWIYPCSALLFFALFGFAEEALRNYRSAFRRLKTILRLNVHDLNLGARLRERQCVIYHLLKTRSLILSREQTHWRPTDAGMRLLYHTATSCILT
ncbi:pheromone A receptor-domain-containing protein [Irpex lacteus]|nr:pheromone A receptor-domain-containing protein [Irpex lacteus]